MKKIPACLFPLALSLLLLAACDRGPHQAGSGASGARKSGAATESVAVTAVLRKDIDLTACLGKEEEDSEPDATSNPCPTYVLQSINYMIGECSTAGGALQLMPEAGIWSLDVDADGKNEVLVDLTQNFTCYGAPAVFSCGSLGCPYFVYSQRDDSWDELGAVNADDAPGIEVLATTKGTPGTLRGGCAGQRPCSELTHYAWKGNAYERSWIEYRGHIVDVVPGGLWTLNSNAAVLTAPSKDGQTIDEYPAGTTVVVMGNSRDGPYKYVSPCNACRRGFMDATVLQK
jgi:hypothetical protein